MRTTLDIDPELLERAEEILGEKSPSKTVNKALREIIRKKAVEDLIAMAGKIDLIDNWRELEEQELAEMKRLEWSS
jgi:Arc/MetJ family transcription regulator